MHSFIDGHLTAIYQLLEARIIYDYDEEILKIMCTFAENANNGLLNLYRTVADLDGVCDQLLPFYPEILHLGSLCLKHHKQLIRSPNLGDQESDAHEPLANNPGSLFAREMATLSQAMIKYSIENKSVKLDIDALDSGLLLDQLTIQYLHPYMDSGLELMMILTPLLSIYKSPKIPSDSYLQSRVLGVFCSAFLCLPQLTLRHIQSDLESLIPYLQSKSLTFSTPLDRRLLILSLIRLFESLPSSPQSLSILDTAIQSLHVQRMEQELKVKDRPLDKNHGLGANTKPVIGIFGIIGPKNEEMKVDKQLKTPKRELSEAEKQDLAAYNFIRGKVYGIDELLKDPEDLENEADNPEDEILNFLLEDTRKAEKAIKNIASPIKDIDEFEQFKLLFANLKKLLGDKINSELVENLSSVSRLVLPGILQCQKIATMYAEDKQVAVEVLPRKIVKVKRREPTQGQEI
jgi:hypothetical protein